MTIIKMIDAIIQQQMQSCMDSLSFELDLQWTSSLMIHMMLNECRIFRMINY